MYVVFVVIGRPGYFVSLLVAKIAILSVCDTILIPGNGAMGIAFAGILTNAVLSAICIILLYRENLLRFGKGLDGRCLKEWARVGFFSGVQVLIANIVYVSMVIRMVNDVSEIGNYWLANNFICGWLLVPVTAVNEMVRRESYQGYRRTVMYIALMILILATWAVSVPFWGCVFWNIVYTEDPDTVLNLLYKLVPFYSAYAFSMVFQGVLVGTGRTDLVFLENVIINTVYYGAVYGLFLYGIFSMDMDSIILMFVGGMVFCMLLD